MNNILETTFGNEKRWVNWRFETIGGKITKIPYYSKNKKASTTNPKTWNTYDNVDMSFSNAVNKFNGIGIVFTDDKTLLGIDFDDCLENGIIKHEKKAAIESFIKKADTYVEISPSGHGLHIFLKLSEGMELVVNKEPKSVIKTIRKPLELYTNNRYFTVTNNSYGDATPVRTISKNEALELLAIIGYPWDKTVTVVNNATTQSSQSFSDEFVVGKLVGVKKNKDTHKLYHGDISDYKGDASSADMALCSHLAFWTGKNAAQMERIWLASPLGKREKTQERKDYRDRTIANAIKNCTSIYETQASKVARIEGIDALDLMFTINKNGEKVFTQNTENICRVLNKHPHFSKKIRYDIFKNIVEVFFDDEGKWSGYKNVHAIILQTEISVLFPCFAMVTKKMVEDAIFKVSVQNQIDSGKDFIESLVWDKQKRLDTWLSTVYGAPDDVYHRAVASNWLKGAMKRLTHPGCKFDYVLVLEGEQGVKKSMSLEILGGEWHTETTMSTESKDFFMQLQGKAFIEFSEGETLSRTEVKRMKAIITMMVDRFRVPYEATSQDFPRRCVFAMTTNQTEYLKDETGNRRWLPVRVVLPEANVEWLAENRNQLFAEAYYRVSVLKETIYEFPKQETLDMQADRQISDPNNELVASWYFGLKDAERDNGITIHQVYRDALNGGYPHKPMSKYDEMSIANMLKNVLKLEKERQMVNGVRMMRWYPTRVIKTVPEVTGFEDFTNQAFGKNNE